MTGKELSVTSPMCLEGKSVLITGGTGSFGQAFVREILKNHNPKRIIIFSRDEYKQYEMQRSLPTSEHQNLRYFIGDIRDLDRLKILQDVDIIIHAAAMKRSSGI